LGRNDLELLRILELHPERRRKRVSRHPVDELLLVREQLPEPIVGLLLRLVTNRLHLGHAVKLLVDALEIGLADVVVEVHSDLNPFGLLVHDQADLSADEPRAAEQERGDEHRGHGGDGHEPVAPEAGNGLPEVIVEPTCHSRTLLATGL
jgi:hypothetical protein